MSIIDSMIQELQYEAQATRKVLERLPEDKWDWQPHPKSMSVCALASHTADALTYAQAVLEMDEFVINMGEYKPFLAANRAELLKAQDENLAKAVETMHGRSDAHLMQLWRLKMGDHVVFELPRAAVLRSMVLNHIVHHRAQLTVYLRLLDVPVPSVYGPSADEQ